MSRRDAIQDGIRIGKDSAGYPCYNPPCCFCAAPVYTWSYQRGTQYACPSCRKEAVAQECEKKEQDTVDKKGRKLETAIKRISKVTDIRPYDRAIRLVRKQLNKSGWFQISTVNINENITRLMSGIPVVLAQRKKQQGSL